MDELLKPRVKVIAPMPFVANKVDSYLRRIEEKNEYIFEVLTENDGNHFFEVVYFKQFPHLFKIAEWWEDRKMEDMP